jgi:hypothetical protein
LRISFGDEKSLWLITASILAAYLFQVALGFSQAIYYKGASLSIKGQLSNSGYYANYLIAFIPMLFSFLISKVIKKHFRIILFFLLLLVLFFYISQKPGLRMLVVLWLVL